MIRPEAFYSKDQAVQIFPGPGGAHNWAPMAFNPVTNLMYIPTSANSSSTYRLPDSFTYQAGRTNMGIQFGGLAEAGRGVRRLLQIRPATGGILEPGAAAGAGFAVPTGPATGRHRRAGVAERRPRGQGRKVLHRQLAHRDRSHRLRKKSGAFRVAAASAAAR